MNFVTVTRQFRRLMRRRHICTNRILKKLNRRNVDIDFAACEKDCVQGVTLYGHPLCGVFWHILSVVLISRRKRRGRTTDGSARSARTFRALFRFPFLTKV